MFIFSGLYPLFKAGGANLGGGFIQAHVTLKPMFGIPRQVSSYQVFVIHGVLFQYKKNLKYMYNIELHYIIK